MSDQTRRTFSDDTTTGERSTLRGPTRVTIVARAEDAGGFDWLLRLGAEHLPAGVELKAKNLLPFIQHRTEVASQVLRHIEAYAIIIVDLYAHRREVARGVVDRISRLAPTGQDPVEFMLRLMEANSNAREWLRQMAVDDSVVGRVENLMHWSANPLADDLGKAGLGDFRTSRPELVPHEQLAAMDHRPFALLLARLGAAVADALSAERQSQVLQDAMSAQRIFTPGYYASHLLRIDIEADRIFDDGPAPVMHRLEQANHSIYEYVERHQRVALEGRVKAGLFEERSSQGELGLQAADVAASIATRAYELATPDENGFRVHAVKEQFANVFFNGRWV